MQLFTPLVLCVCVTYSHGGFHSGRADPERLQMGYFNFQPCNVVRQQPAYFISSLLILSPDGINLNLSSIVWLFSPPFILFWLFLTSSFHSIPFFFAFPSVSMRTTCPSGFLMSRSLTHQIPNMHLGFQEVHLLSSSTFYFFSLCSLSPKCQRW